MFEPFQNFLKKAANKYGVATEIQAAKVCQDFRSLVPEIFPKIETPEKYISPAFFKNHTLTIDVENSAFAQEVIMRKPKIIEEMNRRAGKKIIKNLRTQLRQNMV